MMANVTNHDTQTKQKHGPAGLGTFNNPSKFLFNDLDEATAKHWAAALTASPILTSKLTNNDAYSALPCAYLVLDGDLTLPREYQEGMVQGLQASKAGSSSNFTIYHCPAGHAPHLSWTEGMVDTIREFVEKIRAEQGSEEVMPSGRREMLVS